MLACTLSSSPHTQNTVSTVFYSFFFPLNIAGEQMGEEQDSVSGSKIPGGSLWGC